VPRVEFEADTEEELVSLVWRWVMGPRRDVEHAVAAEAADEMELRRGQLAVVLRTIRGLDSRRLVREVAELSMSGGSLVLDEALRQRYGKSTGTAFAGIVAGPNKVMRRIARRDLLIWDPAAAGYRMHPADAEIVLETWAQP
jgi:hypothetical protein